MLSLAGLKTLRPVHRITVLIFLTALVAALFTMPAFGQPTVHELYYNNSAWVDTNLSALVSGPSVDLGGIAAFNTTPNNQLHVYYLGYDEAERVDHVHQLYFNGSSWSDDDLTALTGGVPGSTEGGLSGFSIGNAQYVYFVGTDFDVHELSYVDNWVDSDLTVLTKGSFGYPYEIASFQTPSNHQRNVFYLGPSKHVHQLLFNGTKWTDQDLTKLTGGENGYGGISAFAIGKKQYVFFESSKKHVEEFLFTSSWVAEDLTVANGLPSVTGTSVAAFAIPGTSKIHVYYNASKSFAVHQLANDTGAWKDENLTALTGGPGGLLTTQTVGFATTPNKQLHVFFPGSPAGDVNQLYYDGTTWVDEDLTVLSGGDQAAGSSGMAGFAIGNLQRLYYVGQ
jgi:hypothetical protein